MPPWPNDKGIHHRTSATVRLILDLFVGTNDLPKRRLNVDGAAFHPRGTLLVNDKQSVAAHIQAGIERMALQNADMARRMGRPPPPPAKPLYRARASLRLSA